jgi:hypothetical protein
MGWDGRDGMGSALSLVNSFENWSAARLITECAVTRFARDGVATFFKYQPLDRSPLDRRVLYGSPVPSQTPFAKPTGRKFTRFTDLLYTPLTTGSTWSSIVECARPPHYGGVRMDIKIF